MFAHRVAPFTAQPANDTVEAIATFCDEPKRTELSRMLSLCHGFAGSYLIDSVPGSRPHAYVVDTLRRFDRFVEVFSALDENQLALLALTKPRLAALTMLDELRGLYATGELAAARRFAERCFHDLEETFPVTDITPEGDLPRPVVREPTLLGRLCESALASFLWNPADALGRVRQLCAIAADLDGGPRSQLETRWNLGRDAFVSPRDFKELLLPENISVTVDGREMWTIPIVSIHERPKLFVPARDRYANPTEVPHPLTALYDRVEERIARILRLQQLGAPAEIIEQQQQFLQIMVDELAAATRMNFDLNALDAWGKKPPPHACSMWTPEMPIYSDGPSGKRPSIVWLTDDRIAVARDDVTRIISLATGKTIRTIDHFSALLQTCDDTGRYLITTSKVNALAPGNAVDGFGCVDVDTGSWLGELPDAIPAVICMMSDSAEEAVETFLMNLRHKVTFTMASDRSTTLAFSRGNRAVLLTDNPGDIEHYGIRSTETLIEEVSYRVLAARRDADAPGLMLDGKLQRANHGETLTDMMMHWDDHWGEAWPAAIANVDGKWRFMLPTLQVGDVDATWFYIGWVVDAACFSPDGKRLAVLGDDVTIVDVEQRAIVQRLP